MTDPLREFFPEPIHVYTRGQALEDGYLVDVTATAREASIKWPVALTAAVYERYVRVPEGVQGQDEAGRLWDILYLLRLAIPRAKGDTFFYGVHVRDDNRERIPPLRKLKVVVGPDDEAKGCFTVMMPDED